MSLERLNKCPLCKSGLFLNHKEVKDFSISQESFILCECAKCKLVFTNPRPKEKNLPYYYQSDDYISHQDKTNSITAILYKLVRNYTIKHKVNLLNQLKPTKGALLDMGCGTGYLLEAATKNGWKAQGIEPGKVARNHARKKGLPIVKSIDKLTDERFDVITLFHVLEHLHDLRKTTKKIITHLKDNGHLIIAVPNIHSWDAQHYGNKWAAWDVPRHLYHFNQESIQEFAQEFDLKLISAKPMVFDSYYVSMLSEKNQGNTGLLSLWNGFINGIKSNQWAKNNQQNYSSILFILKKK
jgi:2-polyprenyl-3-methyl-5-hydroxy-6-metoxy-1,4-benzoquinol methylase